MKKKHLHSDHQQMFITKNTSKKYTWIWISHLFLGIFQCLSWTSVISEGHLKLHWALCQLCPDSASTSLVSDAFGTDHNKAETFNVRADAYILWTTQGKKEMLRYHFKKQPDKFLWLSSVFRGERGWWDVEESSATLSSYSFSQHRLACAWRSDHQHTLTQTETFFNFRG